MKVDLIQLHYKDGEVLLYLRCGEHPFTFVLTPAILKALVERLGVLVGMFYATHKP